MIAAFAGMAAIALDPISMLPENQKMLDSSGSGATVAIYSDSPIIPISSSPFQYNITLHRPSIINPFTPTILTIGTTKYSPNQLALEPIHKINGLSPFGVTVSYSWVDPYQDPTNANKRYAFQYMNLSYGSTTITIVESSGSFSIPFENANLYPVYRTQYYVTFQSSSGGSVTPSGGHWYYVNSNINITASVNPGYVFTGWTLSGFGTISDLSSSSTIATVLGPGTVKANFQAVANTVIFQQSGVTTDYTGNILTVDGTGYQPSQIPNTLSWTTGSIHTFTWSSPLIVSADKQYIWLSASGLNNLQTGSITTPYGGGTVSSTYKTQYKVSFQASTGGSIGLFGSQWYDATSSISINAMANAGYKLSNWITTGNVTATEPTASSTTLTVNGPGTIMANFTSTLPNAGTVTFESSEGGSTVPSGSNSYLNGDTVEISATALSGYQFSYWSVTGSSIVADPTSPSTTLTVNGLSTVTANFQPSNLNPIAGIPTEYIFAGAVAILAIVVAGYFIMRRR